jgi:hypothetical protein
MITIQQVKTAREDIKTLNEYETKLKDEMRKNQDKEMQVLRDKERELNNQIYELKTKHQDIKIKIDDEIKQKRNETYKPIFEFKRIMAFLEVFNSDKNLDYEVYKFDHPRDKHGDVIRTENGNYPEKIRIPFERLKVLANDEFKHIAFYLVENDRKPTNKYSLCIVGRTIFNLDEFKDVRPRNYGLPCHTSGENIAIEVKAGKTREELVRYCDKYKGFNGNLKDLEDLEKEYLEVIKLWELKEWKIAYWENQKDYYEKHYSHGEETPEYKEVLNKLEELK